MQLLARLTERFRRTTAPRRADFVESRRALVAAALLGSVIPAAAQAPAPVPALPDTERRTQYSVSGSTGPLNVGFALYGDSTDYGDWLTVWVNGVQVQAVSGYTLSSPSGSLGTIARPITDAQITFTVPQTGTVQIVGARRPRRLAQFAENRGVPARDLNQAITDATAQLREFWDRQARTLQVEPGSVINLPTPAQRANTFLAFDANGLVTTLPNANAGSGGGGFTAGATFNSASAARSASIAAGTQFVLTAGFSFANDGGAARYMPAGSLVAGGFQSLDGQFWQLASDQVLTLEMFGGVANNPAFDNATACANLTSFIGSTGGYVRFPFPGATYWVWNTNPVTPGHILFNFGAVSGLTFDMNGAMFKTASAFTGISVVFVFNNGAQNISMLSPHFEAPGYSIGTDADINGAQLLSCLQAMTNLYVRNFIMKGGQAGIVCVRLTGQTGRATGITIENGYFEQVYYPLNFQKSGDYVLVRGVSARNVGRYYFPYNVHNHDVEIADLQYHSNVAPTCLLKCYAASAEAGSLDLNTLSDIKLRYRAPQSGIATIGGIEFVAVAFQQETAATASAVIRNIDIHLDVALSPITSGSSLIVIGDKRDSAAAPDVTARGYQMRNIIVSGEFNLSNQPAVAISGFSVGDWTGEFINNITLRDLTVVGGSTLTNVIDIDATHLSKFLTMENVVCLSNNINVTSPGTGVFRTRGVTSANLND